jgi:hypothetical protein
MKSPRSRAARGAALVETVIAMPLFLVALYGVIWGYRTSVLSEQAQESVRYGGLVSALANPYEQFSLYTVYATIDQSTPTHVRDCVGGPSSVVAQGHSAFWQPAPALTPVSPSCGLAIIFPSAGTTYPVLLYSDYVIANTLPKTSGVFGGSTFGGNMIYASQNFFRSPDLGVILNCSRLGFAVKRSLEGDGDPYTPTTVPTPFPQQVIPTNQDIIPQGVAGTCYTTQAGGYGPPTAPY